MSNKDPLVLLQCIAQTLYDKKGINILTLNVKNVPGITDYVIIAESLAENHTIALADAVMDALQKLSEKPAGFDGMKTGDWIVLDYIEYMVHLFSPNVREKYRLELLWQKAEIIDLKIELHPPIMKMTSDHSFL